MREIHLIIKAVGDLSPAAELDAQLLSAPWSGAHLMQTLQGAGKRRLTGWEITGNEYTGEVPGHPAMLQVAQAILTSSDAEEPRAGVLIWGGNAGIHAGGATGSHYPYLLLPDMNALPQHVQRALETREEHR